MSANLPHVETALVGITLAHDALERFLNEYDALVGKPPSQDSDERESDYRRLQDLVALDDVDAAAWQYWLAHMRSVLESTMVPTRIDRARAALGVIVNQLAGDQGGAE